MAEPQDWKPTSYTSLSPYLVVSDARRLIDFAQEVFGARVLQRFDRPDGSVLHAEVRVDDTVFMVSDGSEAYPPFPSMLHLYVDDVDRVFERAIAAGATAIDAPRRQEGDADKRGMFHDPVGTTWAIATRVGG